MTAARPYVGTGQTYVVPLRKLENTMKKVMKWSRLDVNEINAETMNFTVTGNSLKTMNGVTDEFTANLDVQIDTKYVIEKFCNQVIYGLDSFKENKDGQLSAKAEIMFIPWSDGVREFDITVNNETPWNCKRESGVVTASSAMRNVEKMNDAELRKFRELIEAKMAALDTGEDDVEA